MHSGPNNARNMKTPSVKDIIASFPHPILPTVQGEPDYHTIHAIRKLLQANSRSIDSHLGVVLSGISDLSSPSRHTRSSLPLTRGQIRKHRDGPQRKSLAVRQLKSPPNAIFGRRQLPPSELGPLWSKH
jgi:hypothetical protein